MSRVRERCFFIAYYSRLFFNFEGLLVTSGVFALSSSTCRGRHAHYLETKPFSTAWMTSRPPFFVSPSCLPSPYFISSLVQLGYVLFYSLLRTPLAIICFCLGIYDIVRRNKRILQEKKNFLCQKFFDRLHSIPEELTRWLIRSRGRGIVWDLLPFFQAVWNHMFETQIVSPLNTVSRC